MAEEKSGLTAEQSIITAEEKGGLTAEQIRKHIQNELLNAKNATDTTKLKEWISSELKGWISPSAMSFNNDKDIILNTE
ncbi:MAG: hypothetical protein EB127_25810, partial [Alphaproteobacteria bacterium]|nr:hypothetical protein [Alphaproteobacteria bacterium]